MRWARPRRDRQRAAAAPSPAPSDPLEYLPFVILAVFPRRPAGDPRTRVRSPAPVPRCPSRDEQDRRHRGDRALGVRLRGRTRHAALGRRPSSRAPGTSGWSGSRPSAGPVDGGRSGGLGLHPTTTLAAEQEKPAEHGSDDVEDEGGSPGPRRRRGSRGHRAERLELPARREVERAVGDRLAASQRSLGLENTQRRGRLAPAARPRVARARIVEGFARRTLAASSDV